MHAFGESRSQPVRVLIDQDIVDVIIGDMMFHPEDVDGFSRLVPAFLQALSRHEILQRKQMRRRSVGMRFMSIPSSSCSLCSTWLEDFHFAT